tara:strand:- start:1705 stop:2079 length:375 start_codon:yes stop_codon:yes gene_type:complete
MYAYFDGSAAPNPGRMRYGVSIQDASGREIAFRNGFAGFGSNNTAEYIGLVNAIELCESLGISDVTIRGDSQLVINQITEKWRTKDMIALKKYATSLIAKSTCNFRFEHVMRHENKRADELSWL